MAIKSLILTDSLGCYGKSKMLKIVIRNGTTQKTFVTEFSVTKKKKINTQVFLLSDVRPIKWQRNNDKYI